MIHLEVRVSEYNTLILGWTRIGRLGDNIFVQKMNCDWLILGWRCIRRDGKINPLWGILFFLSLAMSPETLGKCNGAWGCKESTLGGKCMRDTLETTLT